MKYHHFFISITVFCGLIIIGFYLHNQRPKFEQRGFQPQVQHVKASGKCVECHRRETSSIVHQFEGSKHIQAGVNCLDCHQPASGQEGIDHKGFVISLELTAKNCASCHQTEYNQFAKSRHAGPAWAAVRGRMDFTPEQLAFGEKFHPGTIDRDHNKLSLLEPDGAVQNGCLGCHSIGKPNRDGSFGSCTECHTKHNPSVAFARKPRTCAQCHLGPDHSQYEIYSESKHGTIFQHIEDKIHWNAPPKKLTSKDFPVPTCATCHMSGLEGMKVTHDTTERLSWFLYAPVSKGRPHFQRAREEMKEVCLKCHTQYPVDEFFKAGDKTVASTNKVIQESFKIYNELKKQGKINKKPFDESIDFLVFDIWHYYGRTAKHGAFMGGADYVQWHGNYELLHKMVKLKEMAKKAKRKTKKKK